MADRQRKTCSLIAVVLVVRLANPASLAAQSVGTQCSQSAGITYCNSTPGIIYNPGPDWGKVAAGIGNLFAQAAARRQADQLAQQYSQAQAAAAERERQRREAAQRLFADKANTVVSEFTDSLRIFGASGQAFMAAVTSALVDLYLVNPLASSDQIRDVVKPHVARLSTAYNAFVVRVATSVVPGLMPDSLSQVENQALLTALQRKTQDLFMTEPEATPDGYRAAVGPLFARARVVFDSMRRVSGLPPLPHRPPA